MVIRDQKAGTGVPNHLQELRFVEVGVLLDLREGLLDPFRNGGQVGFGHRIEKGGAVINQQAKVFSSERRWGRGAGARTTALRLGATTGSLVDRLGWCLRLSSLARGQFAEDLENQPDLGSQFEENRRIEAVFGGMACRQSVAGRASKLERKLLVITVTGTTTE
jgi:hypothetical protein